MLASTGEAGFELIGKGRFVIAGLDPAIH